jgi:hypothetical protein
VYGQKPLFHIFCILHHNDQTMQLLLITSMSIESQSIDQQFGLSHLVHPLPIYYGKHMVTNFLLQLYSQGLGLLFEHSHLHVVHRTTPLIINPETG